MQNILTCPRTARRANTSSEIVMMSCLPCLSINLFPFATARLRASISKLNNVKFPCLFYSSGSFHVPEGCFFLLAGTDKSTKSTSLSIIIV